MSREFRGHLENFVQDWVKSWNGADHRGASPSSQFRTSGEYFLSLRLNGQKDAAIRDHWQGLSDVQRQQLVPADWQLLITKTATNNGRPARTRLRRLSAAEFRSHKASDESHSGFPRTSGFHGGFFRSGCLALLMDTFLGVSVYF